MLIDSTPIQNKKFKNKTNGRTRKPQFLFPKTTDLLPSTTGRIMRPSQLRRPSCLVTRTHIPVPQRQMVPFVDPQGVSESDCSQHSSSLEYLKVSGARVKILFVSPSSSTVTSPAHQRLGLLNSQFPSVSKALGHFPSQASNKVIFE